MAFELEDFHRNISDDELIADLVRVSQELHKKQITFRDYNRSGKYHSSTVATRFGSWHGALGKAGLDKTIDRNIPTEDLFRNIVEVWSALGRQASCRLSCIAIKRVDNFIARFFDVMPQPLGQ